MLQRLAAVLSAITAVVPAQKKAADRDEFATTPEARATVETAKQNLIAGWDYFTTPNLVVLYAFEPDKADKRAKALADARVEASVAELMWKRFERDLPPHAEMGRQVPILRLFPDRATRERYLGHDHGQKEQEQAGLGEVLGLRGDLLWLQYRKRWLGELEPDHWFSMVCSKRYGRLRAEGKDLVLGGVNLKHMRKQLAEGSIDELVRTQFDGSDPTVSARGYAMAAALADLLERGPAKLGKKFDPRWGRILTIHAETLRATKDYKKATAAAWEGIDKSALDAVIRDWAEKYGMGD